MDPVDKYPEITEACKGNCVTDWQNYEACKVRIAQKGSGDCEPWYFDFYKCVDRCRVPRFKEVVVRK